jgi:quinol monooxygenase YgiN
MIKRSIPLTLLLFTYWAVWRFNAASGSTTTADEPLYVVTHVDVMPKFVAPARELLKQFATASRDDAGAVRVEVMEELNRPNHSTVVEVWKNAKAYEDHLAAEHTRAYRTKLQPMLGSPFDERLHRLSATGADR